MQRLHFISFEKYPLKAEDLRPAHQRWPELAPWRSSCRRASAFGGCHRLLLDGGRVTLDLWFGDINELTRELDDSLNQQVDAPGFLTALPRRKIPTCGLRICSAPWRRRGPAGRWPPLPPPVLFAVACRRPALPCKVPGRKREMLTGEMAQTLSFPARAPGSLAAAMPARRPSSAADRQRPCSPAAAPRLDPLLRR